MLDHRINFKDVTERPVKQCTAIFIYTVRQKCPHMGSKNYPHNATKLHSSIATVVYRSAPFLSSETMSLPPWIFSPNYTMITNTTEVHVSILE